MKNWKGLKLLASLNVPTGTLYGLNFATESEVWQEVSHWLLVSAYMSLSIGLHVSPHISSCLVERWHYKVKTLSKLIENLQVQLKHDYEAAITAKKTFKDDISFLTIDNERRCFTWRRSSVGRVVYKCGSTTYHQRPVNQDWKGRWERHGS